jgi:hypothetical protein
VRWHPNHQQIEDMRGGSSEGMCWWWLNAKACADMDAAGTSPMQPRWNSQTLRVEGAAPSSRLDRSRLPLSKAAGVEFIDDENGGGPGVRLRK